MQVFTIGRDSDRDLWTRAATSSAPHRGLWLLSTRESGASPGSRLRDSSGGLVGGGAAQHTVKSHGTLGRWRIGGSSVRGTDATRVSYPPGGSSSTSNPLSTHSGDTIAWLIGGTVDLQRKFETYIVSTGAQRISIPRGWTSVAMPEPSQR
jgi:hypothetical protein